MNTDEIVDWIAIVSTLVCSLFSILLTCQKNHRIDRVFPFLWQIVFWFLELNSYNHGFPGEEFRLMIVFFGWSIVASIIAYRLLRIHTLRTQVFAWSQITQVISLTLLDFLAYVSSCWRHYGHIVWNP